MTDTTDNTITEATNALVRNVTNSDFDRLSVIAALVNVFNYAVQIQAGRNNWDEYDAQSFSIALGAIDAIGSRHRKTVAEKPAAKPQPKPEEELHDSISELVRGSRAERFRLPQNRL